MPDEDVTAIADSPKSPNTGTASDLHKSLVPTDSDGAVVKPVIKLTGIPEVYRTGSTKSIYWEPSFDVEEGSDGNFREIIERTQLLRAPFSKTPAPTDASPFGTTDMLFSRIQKAIAAEASLSTSTSALLTYWAFSTWFSEALTIAPALAIVGPPDEGDLVLRALRNFCHLPMMISGVNLTDLGTVSWDLRPTLLFFAPTLTTQMASLLGCTTGRDYLINDAGRYRDFYGPKAIYLGEEAAKERTPWRSLQVNLNPSTESATQHQPRLSKSAVQNLMNQLQQYRLTNLAKVYSSDFDAPALISDTRTVAKALGACVVDSPNLQSRLISLLRPASDQQQADRSTSLEGLTIEAILNLCHEGKTRILVGEIASEGNGIAKSRGDRLSYSAEIFGHRIKKIGLVTRRLGKAGNGLVMDQATLTRVHEIAAAYSVGLEKDEKNLRCPLCAESKRVM